jgi:hypothetical protein
MGLSHFQHSAAHFLFSCTGTLVSLYIKGVAKLIFFTYDAKAMNSTSAAEHNSDLLKWKSHKTFLLENFKDDDLEIFERIALKSTYENHGVCVCVLDPAGSE